MKGEECEMGESVRGMGVHVVSVIPSLFPFLPLLLFLPSFLVHFPFSLHPPPSLPPLSPSIPSLPASPFSLFPSSLFSWGSYPSSG